MPAVSRDHPAYWNHRPSDHSVEGLFVGATEGDGCSLGRIGGFTHCAVSAATPENTRKQYVRYKAREAEGGDHHALRTGYGLYGRPRKPANSGRKRRGFVHRAA